MKYYVSSNNTILVKRHLIIIFFRFAKFIFLLILSGFLYIMSLLMFPSVTGEIGSILKFIDFIFITILLNYAFFTLILGLISYYNNIIVIASDSITIIRCSLFLQNDIEVIDSYRVVKVDAFCHGVIANFLGYGEIVIEQQKNEVRVFHFISQPYKLLGVIKQQRETILQDPKNAKDFKKA